MNKRLKKFHHFLQLLFKAGRQDHLICKPFFTMRRCVWTRCELNQTCKTRRKTDIWANQYRCDLRSKWNMYFMDTTYGCVFGTPLGATFSSSSAPKIFLLPPSGSGLAFPNSFTNFGAEMASRRRVEERWILALRYCWTAAPRLNKVKVYLMVCNSFFPGHHVPAAMIEPSPGLTIWTRVSSI